MTAIAGRAVVTASWLCVLEDSILGTKCSRRKVSCFSLCRYLEHHLKPKLAPLLISSKLTQGDRVVLVRSKANPDNLNIVVSHAVVFELKRRYLMRLLYGMSVCPLIILEFCACSCRLLGMPVGRER